MKAYCFTIDGDKIFADFDIADRGGRERNNIRDSQRAFAFVVVAIETNAETADRWSLRRVSRRANSRVRSIQFAEHLRNDPAQFIGRAGAGGERRVLIAN